ncbi:hypothetical protein, partial [Lentzea sp. NPDC003310]|uniref:hypothetical protein n=1 Tax=Lentzea sp. NPDC003310 TaxID=3154447 RepID=UPI0033A17927
MKIPAWVLLGLASLAALAVVWFAPMVDVCARPGAVCGTQPDWYTGQESYETLLGVEMSARFALQDLYDYRLLWAVAAVVLVWAAVRRTWPAFATAAVFGLAVWFWPVWSPAVLLGAAAGGGGGRRRGGGGGARRRRGPGGGRGAPPRAAAPPHRRGDAADDP